MEISEKQYYYDGIKNTMKALFDRRRRAGKWEDEVAIDLRNGKEFMPFSVAEALDTFFRVYYLDQREYPRLALGDDHVEILLADTKLLIKYVNENGFDPHPYSLAARPWESTEFAAFFLPFCCDADCFFKAFRERDKTIFRSLNGLCIKALDFLQESHLRERGLMSWAPAKTTKLGEEPKTSSYSTSLVLFGINWLTRYEPLFDALNKSYKEYCRQCLEEGVKWLMECIDGRRFREFIGGGRDDLGISLAAVEALSGVDFGPAQAEKFETCFKDVIDDATKQPTAAASQFNFTAYPSKGDPFVYDPRWSSKRAVISLAAASDVARRDVEFEKKFFYLLSKLQRLYWDERVKDSNLWNPTSQLIGGTYRGVVATVDYILKGQPREFKLTEGQIRLAIKQALSSEAFFQTLLKEFEEIQAHPDR